MPTLGEDLANSSIQTTRPLARCCNTSSRGFRIRSRRAACSGAVERSLRYGVGARASRSAHLLEPETLQLVSGRNLLVEMGDYEAALAIFRDAMSLKPTEESGSSTALMLHRLGRIEESSWLCPIAGRHRTRPLRRRLHVRGMAMLLRDAAHHRRPSDS